MSNSEETANRSLFHKYILPKIKFGVGSLISTTVDYALFFGLIWANIGLPIGLIQGIALSIAIAVNFTIQRNFIFRKERSLIASMGWSISFSILSVVLSSFMIHFMNMIPVFNAYPILMKLIVTGLFFLFNFYTKQYSFEKKVEL